MELNKNTFLKFSSLPSRNAYFVKVIVSLGLFIPLVVCVFNLSFPYCIAPQFFLGCLFLHMKELQHEALHGGFKRKYLNRLVGIFLGLPMLVSYSNYKYHHLLHHKYTGTTNDTEFFTYTDQKSQSFLGFFWGLFMADHYKQTFKKMIDSVFFNKSTVHNQKIKKKIRQENLLFMILILSLMLGSFLVEDFFIATIKIWLMPLCCFTIPLNFLIELPEHVFCKKNTKDIFINTRTIRSNWLMTWFVNGNNYHVEHHFSPTYPISELPILHQEIKYKISYLDKSYTEFYTFFFKKLMEKVSHKVLQ